MTFIAVDIWGRTAENVGQYMRKGSPILIEGRLKLDQWDDKQTGQKRSRLGVTAETVQFLSSGNRGGAEGAAAPATAPRARPTPPPNATGDADAPPPPEDDDVPF